MSFTHYNLDGNVRTSRSISGLQSSPSSYQNGRLHFRLDMDLYALTGTPTPYDNSLPDGINDSATQHGSSVFDKSVDRSRNQHGHSTYDWSTNQHGVKNKLSTSMATFSAQRRIPTAHKHIPTTTFSFPTNTTAAAHTSKSNLNRTERLDDLYTSTLALYKDDDDDSDEVIKRCLKCTTVTQTASNYIPSTSTTNDNYPTYSQNDIYPNQTTIKPAPLNQQQPNYTAIESYIDSMERKSSSRQPEQQKQSNNSTFYNSPPSSVSLSSSDLWESFDIPKTKTTITTKATTAVRRSQIPSVSHSDKMSILISDDDDDLEIPNSTASTPTAVVSIFGSDDELIQLRKRRKVDKQSDVEPKLRLLEMNEVFECDEPIKSTQATTRRGGYSRKVNGKTETERNDLVMLLKGITILDTGQQGKSDLDEKEELAFFDDEETPKHNTKNRPLSKQSLVNGFDGFSDVEEDGG